METLQAGAAIRKCLEAEEVLGIIRMGMEIQTTTTTLFEFTPENYVTSEWIIHLKKRGKTPHRWQRWPEVCYNSCNKEKSYKIVPLA